MIGQQITGEDGNPLQEYTKLTKSTYQPSEEIKKLFLRVQSDYQIAYALQHRPFKEFDGFSLLDRARLDQETFGAFVGAEFVPKHKRWRWRGRKNTSRNKLIGIVARAIAGMLYPMVHAKNEEDEEDKMSARVMRILVEEHLRKANYEINFLFFVLSALVNPAVFIGVEWLEVMQTIKMKMADGKVAPMEIVDELLSGLALHAIPIDELMLSDFFTGTGRLQPLPFVLRVRRIPYDLAKGIYKGKHFDKDGKDLFDYVQAGKTRIFLTGNENQELFDIEWTEADKNYVQEITAYYRSEDLQVTFVGGVFMNNEEDPYNTNPFDHRRMTLVKDQWLSAPIYPFVMSGFEPIDPAGRFAWFKSGAFKEYWDDQALNTMHRLMLDGTYLDVIKPMFLSGVAKVDSTIIVPGATVGMPQGATVTPFTIGPNLVAAYNAIKQQNEDINDSTQSDPAPATPTPNVPATQTTAAVQQAKLFFSVFSLMMAHMIEELGALVMDCVVQYTTVGDVDTKVPEALRMKFKTYLAKGKDKGKAVTNKVTFTDKHMGREYSDSEKEKLEWDLYDKSGGEGSDQRIYEVNPYKFARTIYSMYVDADQIVMKSMGVTRQEKVLAFNMMSDPRVLPYTDPQAVADDFVIEEFGGDDPDKYKNKSPSPDMLNSIMGTGAPPGPGGMVESPLQRQPIAVQ